MAATSSCSTRWQLRRTDLDGEGGDKNQHGKSGDEAVLTLELDGEVVRLGNERGRTTTKKKNLAAITTAARCDVEDGLVLL
jgi:hypothetical protein